MKSPKSIVGVLGIASAILFSCQDTHSPPLSDKLEVDKLPVPNNADLMFALSVPHSDSSEQLDSPTCQTAWLTSGFYHPLGNGNERVTARFLASGCGTSTEYLTGNYHIGLDITPPTGTPAYNSPVYAVSEGRVVRVSPNGWGTGNVGVFVRHWDRNGPFYVGYGHVFANKLQGDTVLAGTTIGRIGRWPYGDHLHVGLYPSGWTNLPSANLGLMPCSSWPSTNGFIDPIASLLLRRPSLRCPDPFDNQAKLDMEGFISRNPLQFGPPYAGVFSKKLSWTSTYELRTQAFIWGGGNCKVAYVHVARHKTLSNVRYVCYRNPDTGITSDWVQVTW